MKTLPAALIDSLHQLPFFDEAKFVACQQESASLSVRLNAAKPSASFAAAAKVPWCISGRYLEERPSFTLDPLFHAGAYYVQEASSMFLEQAFLQTMDASAPLRVLDLCAAPGGKSTLLASLLSDKSLLISNEVIKSRVSVLTENLAKWGYENVFVTNNDPSHFARIENYFDLIVVDAPCSGSGLFRKDEKAIDEWSPENVNLCSSRQQRILQDVLPALKPGGKLIYSTCSFSKQENEEVGDWLCEFQQMKSLRLQIPKDWSIIETYSDKHQAAGYRFYPYLIKGEGFFLSVFQKNESVAKTVETRKAKEKHNPPGAGMLPFLNTGDWAVEEINGFQHLMHPEHVADYKYLKKNLYLQKAGICAGRLAAKDFIPEHELALSRLVSPNLPTLSLTHEQALAYLRRHELDILPSLKGWTLATYQHINLGWMKVLPNRINNYYPVNWRILK